MKIKHLLLPLALCLAGLPAFAQIAIDSADFAGKTNSQIIQEMQSLKQQLRRFKKFSERSRDREEQEQRIVPAMKLDTTLAFQKYGDVLNTAMLLWQQIDGGHSKISLETQRIRSLDYEGNGFRISLQPQKIFLHDGSVLPGSTFEETDMDVHFGNMLETRKKVDSILFDVVMKYTAATASAKLSKASPEAMLDGKKLVLKELNGKHALFNYPSGFDLLKTEGINAAGKVVDQSSSASGTGSPESQRKAIDELDGVLDRMLPAMMKDSLMDNSAFIQKYISMATREQARFAQPGDLQFQEFNFTGNIQALRIYSETREGTVHSLKTIPAFADELLMDINPGRTILYDAQGLEVFRSDKEYGQLNDHYFQDKEAYYYFNPQTRQMQPLQYFNISKLDAGYVSAQQDQEEKYLILDKDNLRVENTFFDRIALGEGVIAAYKDEDVLLLTADGKRKWLRNTMVLDFENGYAVVIRDDKYGFVNERGELVVPAEYDLAEAFSHFSDLLPGDHLFAVKKGGKYGFVNAQNKTVIPFIYEDADPFSYGVTLVQKDGKFGLINTRNEVLADFESGSQATSANFGKRMYSLSNGNYDHLGRKMKEQEGK